MNCIEKCIFDRFYKFHDPTRKKNKIKKQGQINEKWRLRTGRLEFQWGQKQTKLFDVLAEISHLALAYDWRYNTVCTFVYFSGGGTFGLDAF